MAAVAGRTKEIAVCGLPFLCNSVNRPAYFPLVTFMVHLGLLLPVGKHDYRQPVGL